MWRLGLRRCCAGLLVAACTTIPVVAAAAPPDPPANIAPVPNFDVQCVTEGRAVVSGLCSFDPETGGFTFLTQAREAAGLQALDGARLSQALEPLRLPEDWNTLSADQQQFVLVNLFRLDSDLPPIVAEAPALDAVALAGAQADADPQPGTAWSSYATASNWAGDGQPAIVMYGYMELDGWGGSAAGTPNVDCAGPTAPGCWGHRDAVLGDYGTTGLLGVGTTSGGPSGTGSSAQFYVAYDGPPLAIGYTWAQALAAGAAGGGPQAPAANALWPFADMGSDPWAAGAAATLAGSGVVEGTGASTFSPDTPVDLEEMVSFLARALSFTPDPAAALPGTDAWAAGAMGAAAAAGLLPAGVPPTQPLTRLQTVQLVVGALGLPPVSVAMPFTDLGGLPGPDVAVLTTAVADGLLQGAGGAQLDAGGGLTRAEAVVLLLRALLLQARDAQGQAGSPHVGVQTLADGRVLYRIGGMRLLASSAAADPTVYWAPADGNLLAEAAGAWWCGTTAWTPQAAPGWATGATGFGAATAALWPAGMQGEGPATFGPTVQVVAFSSQDVQELLPGASAWTAAPWALGGDPGRVVADALG